MSLSQLAFLHWHEILAYKNHHYHIMNIKSFSELFRDFLIILFEFYNIFIIHTQVKLINLKKKLRIQKSMQLSQNISRYT